jgi:hypothetical protein
VDEFDTEVDPVLKQALAMLGQSRRIPRLALWPPCGQQCPDTHTDRDRCSATTSNDVSAPTSIDVLAGFPKPRVAGSIPARGHTIYLRKRLVLSTGLGDGLYPVEARCEDVAGAVRIAQVRVRFLPHPVIGYKLPR